MRIVGWAEFSKMPKGTVFQIAHNQTGDWGSLQVLDEIWTWEDDRGDFVTASLLPVVMPGILLTDANQETLALGHPHSDMVTVHPDMLCRDGLFEFDRRWLVWEREDLERLAGWLLDPMKALHAIGYRIGEIALPTPEGVGA